MQILRADNQYPAMQEVEHRVEGLELHILHSL